MGKILFIRVAAITYDEDAIGRAWPFLTDLAWPPPLPLVHNSYEEYPAQMTEKTIDAEAPEDKDSSIGESLNGSRQREAEEVHQDAVLRVENGEEEKGKSFTDKINLARIFKSLWKMEPLKKKPVLNWNGEFSGGPYIFNVDQAQEYGKPRGVVDLIERLVDLADYGQDLDEEVREILAEFSPRFSSLLERLDLALTDWDAHRAHSLTNEIEETLDEAENAFYY